MELAGTGIRSAQELARPGESGVDGDQELGKTQFLELMITQMKHQDPLDPAKNEDFIAQLAQFSTVEGIENLNNAFSGLATSMRTGMATDAAALVGRSVVAPTNTTQLAEDGNVSGSVEVPRASGEITLEITNAAGEMVNRLDLGAQDAGRLRFGWDGTTSQGEQAPAGFYRIRAYGDVDGERGELTVNMPDQVVSVSIGADGVTANLAGGGSVPASQIKEIQ